MLKKGLLFSLLLFSMFYMCKGQIFIKASDLFPVTVEKPGAGILNIIQDPAIDTLLSRYILSNKLLTEPNGFRILIYKNQGRTARDESNKVRAEFIVLFPETPSYIEFQGPNYFLVLAGNFRTKVEGTKLLILIKNKYPDAIFVPYIINYSDLNKN